MGKKKTKKLKRNRYIVITALIIAAVITGAAILSSNTRASVEVETVLTGTAEEKVLTKGFLVRDEFVVNSPEDGIVSFRSDEGERVSRGSTVAVVYSGEVSNDVKSELSSIHERLSEIEGSSAEKNLYASDSLTGNAQIVNNIDAISDASYSKDVSKVSQYKDDITRIIRKNEGVKETALTTYEQLKKRKEELEQSVFGQATALYSPRAGVLCSAIDGYEEYFNISRLEGIMPSYLDKPQKAETGDGDSVKKDQPCFKIVNNYTWYYVANVDEKYAESLRECIKYNMAVSLRFSEVSDEKIDAEIYSVSEPQNGLVTVVVKSGGIFSGMYNMREVNAEIIRKTYEGFKVSKEAIHVDEDGSYYVFVNSEGIVKRRDVKILYSDEVYAIIQQKNSESNNLLLYDEVIVSGKGIEEGKSL